MRPDADDARAGLIILMGFPLTFSPIPGSSSERLALFIDGENFHAAAKALNVQVDYRKLKGYFANQGSVVDARFYTLCRTDGYTPLRPLLDWLSYNGFTVIVRPHRGFADGERGGARGGVAIKLACDAIDLVPHVDKIVLCTGDGCYQALAKFAQQRGVQVSAVSTRQCKPPMIADELRRQIDDFIELADILPAIAVMRNETARG